MAEAFITGEKVFRGIPVSAGVCQGRVMVLGRRRETVAWQKVSAEEVPRQIERLEQALVATRKQIQEVQHKVAEAMGGENASIFEAHLLVLEDRTLMDEVVRMMEQEQVSADYAFHQIANKYAATLGAIDDEYLRERVADMKDVVTRVLNNLWGGGDRLEPPQIKEPCVVVSDDLSPSVTAQFDRQKVLGFATDIGSKTSHTAILARSLQIPAVVGLQTISQQLENGQYVLLDGINGLVILNPTDQTLFEYGKLVRKQAGLHEKLLDVKDKPAVTLDGHAVILSANVEHASDTVSVLQHGAAGVGLFRTEFLFIAREVMPSEDEQYQAYQQVAAALKPQAVVIRTLDLGGDKFMTHLKLPPEMNPFLGWRAIRFCLQETAIFKQQLRAILRASAEGNVKIMYPMISGLGELLQANALLEECRQELRAKGVPFDPNMDVGIMIEIPAAVMVAESLAKRVNFFSLGTNDLIQYALAVDRVNEKIAHLYEPTNPAVLKLIKTTVEAAHQAGIWVGVCGEMAGDPALVPLLLGLGVDELSVAAPLVPEIKFLIRRLKWDETRQLAEFALQCESGSEILARAEAFARAAAPSLFENQS